MDRLTTADFHKPSPGNWVWDHTHQSHPHPPLIQGLLERGMDAGFRGAFDSVGVLLELIESRHVHGWIYQCARPIGAPPEPKGPPPWLIFKLATTFHPELRRRIRRASDAWQTKPWKEAAHRWSRVEADHRQSMLELQRLDRASMTRDELVEKLGHAIALGEQILCDHFLEAVPAGIPVGDLFVFAESHGIPASRTALVLSGASPETSRPTRLMRTIIDALWDAGDLDLLDGDEQAVLAALKSHPTAGDAANAYLDEYAYRALEIHIDIAQTLIERPDLVVRTLRSLRDTGDRLPDTDPGLEAAAAIRADLPEDAHTSWDARVADAREGIRHRESSAGLAAWAVGIVRLFALELGARLASEAELDEAADIFLLRDDELSARPEIAEIRRRRDAHAAAAAVRPPRLLGVDVAPPPSDWLPAPVARLDRAVQAYISRFDAGPDRDDDCAPLTGLGVSTGKVAGQVFRLDDFDQLDRVPVGCILVTKSTNPTLNPVLPIIGGLVTELGGLICHAAIMARELGFPGVVGCPAALTLEHGSWVEVDGTTGEVTVLDGPVDVDVSGRPHHTFATIEPQVPTSPGRWVALAEADDIGRFGGKAARLAAAVSAGHRVPNGIALDVDFVEAIAANDAGHLEQLSEALASLDGPLAVRSSAPAEDGNKASFAGMHHTALGVAADKVAEAIRAVWQSGVAPAAQAYRARLGIEGRPQMAVLIQELVPAQASGVRFGRDPVTGEDVRIVESAFGLGALVVDGRVKPDRVRLSRTGEVLERTTGDTPIKLVPSEDGGVCEVPVEPGEQNPIHNGVLSSVHKLGEACDALFESAQDIEWAVVDGQVWLLQSRPITTGARS